MRVIIAGSRSITDINEVKKAINASGWKGNIDTIISGTARGVDQLGEQCADLKKWSKVLFPANWERSGRAAGYYRNTDMAEYADRLIAVWDGKSKGTLHMIHSMKELGKAVFVWSVEHQAGTFIPSA